MSSYLHSLSFRVTFWVSLVVVTIVSIHIALMRPGERFFEQKLGESERVAGIIETHLLVEMSAGEADNIQTHLQHLPHLEGIHRVEVVTPDQSIHFSSDSTRLGNTVDLHADMPCLACHRGHDRPPNHVVYEDPEVGRVFVAGHALSNRVECQRCHTAGAGSLGSILVELELAQTDDAALAVRQRLIAVGTVLLVILVMGLGTIIHWLVGRPARALLAKMTRIEAAEFDIGEPQTSSDEFGALDRGFHNMVGQLQGLYEEMEAKIDERTNSLYQTQAQVMHQEKLAGIGQLAAGVAHEIGNPLTAIDSLVQLLAVETEDEATSESLRTIQHQVDRISEIVHNMADLSRPLSLVVQPVNVNNVVHAVLRLVRYDARFRNIETITSLDDGLPSVMTVEDRLFGVFLNLILNAVDAMPAGGRLTIELMEEPGSLAVGFTDTGHGIPPEHHDRIFEPYFTTKGPSAGTGLGLSVCREFLRSIGGDLEVSSTPGAGATFWVRIPLQTPPEGQDKR